MEQCPALNLEGIKLQPWAPCPDALAWRGCLSWIMEQLGKAGRAEPGEVTKSKCHLRLRLGGCHRDAWGQHSALSSWEGRELQRGMKTERNEEQSGQKVWKQLLEEDEVPQVNGFSRCFPPREVLASQRGLTRREKWKQRLWVLLFPPSMGIHLSFSSSMPFPRPLSFSPQPVPFPGDPNSFSRHSSMAEAQLGSS